MKSRERIEILEGIMDYERLRAIVMCGTQVTRRDELQTMVHMHGRKVPARITLCGRQAPEDDTVSDDIDEEMETRTDNAFAEVQYLH